MRVIHKMDSQDLKRVGLKVTQPRRLVLETIRTSSERHLSAEDVHRRLLKQGGDVGSVSYTHLTLPTKRIV